MAISAQFEVLAVFFTQQRAAGYRNLGESGGGRRRDRDEAVAVAWPAGKNNNRVRSCPSVMRNGRRQYEKLNYFMQTL